MNIYTINTLNERVADLQKQIDKYSDDVIYYKQLIIGRENALVQLNEELEDIQQMLQAELESMDHKFKDALK